MRVENSKMIYRGSNGLSKVYRGQTVVWQQGDVDYSRQYLTFEAIGIGGTFTFDSPTGRSEPFDIEFSINNGQWIHYASASTQDRRLNAGDKVRVKGTNPTYSYNYETSGIYGTSGQCSYMYLSSSASKSVDIYGNIMSLVYGDNFIGQTALTEAYNFQYLFEAVRPEDNAQTVNIRNAGNLILPATSVPWGAYRGMFSHQAGLITAPALPATYVGRWCYQDMFYYCSALTVAPELPATTLNFGCYEYMFQDCHSLQKAPVLRATKLVRECYCSMFESCYALNEIKCLATDISANFCTSHWVLYVAQSGTFIKDPQMTSWPTEYPSSYSGIPEGWTVVDDNT